MTPDKERFYTFTYACPMQAAMKCPLKQRVYRVFPVFRHIFRMCVMRHIDTDTGTEELAHEEIIAAILYQLTRNMSPDDIWASGFEAYFTDHTAGVYPQAASGMPFSAATLQSTGDAITDLFEDLAAEQKARTTYDNLLRLIDDPDVRDPLKFLREREIVHFQRFGEAL